MSSGSMINQLATITFTTVEALPTTTGENSIAYVVALSPADVIGRTYRTAAAVTADADLHADDKAAIIAMISAAGSGLGTVYVTRYDTSSSNAGAALTALMALGYVPGWHYMHIVVAERVDAEIAFASAWVAALSSAYKDLAIVYGQLNDSSIVSGTAPAGIEATAGAAKTVVVYDDRDAQANVERFVGRIAGSSKPINPDPAVGGRRPALAYVTAPSGVTQMTADLTDAQLALVMGRSSGQASCVTHAKVTPVSAASTDRQFGQGHTVGRTLLDVEYSVARLKLDLLVRIASASRARSAANNPLRATADDARVLDGAIRERLSTARDLGYLDRRPVADATLGFPALPDGFTVSASASSTTISAAVQVSIGPDVRNISIPAIGFVG